MAAGALGGSTGFAVPAALADAAVAAGIAALLGLPLVGLRTVTKAGGLAIETRIAELAIAVALVFAGRLAMSAIRGGRTLPALVGGVVVAIAGWQASLPSQFLAAVCIAGGAGVALVAGGSMIRRSSGARADRQPLGLGRVFQRAPSWLGPLLIGFAIILPFLPFVDRRLLDICVLVLTYIMLGWGLNIVVGLAGLLDLGYVAFYAVGAYSFALLAVNFDLGFWASLPLAGVFAAFFGVLLGFPVLRLRGDYLAIVTLGFGEMVRIILLNWYELTNGPDGISGIPQPSLFGLSFKRRTPEDLESFHQFFGIEYSSVHRIMFLYFLILALALITNAFTLRIRRLPIGRAWEALRDDEIACRSLGINPTSTKLSAFAIGAMFAGFAGSFFATRQAFISPESFVFLESAIILAIVVLGGRGSQMGVVLAAIVLIGLPEWFREFKEYRMLAFGAGMVLIMIWRPRGLLAHREPTLRLAGRGGGR